MLAITLVFLLISYARNPYRLDDPIVLGRGAALVLEQRLDPNTADAPSLSPCRTLAKRWPIASWPTARRTSKLPPMASCFIPSMI